jgi:preprotein translocase subunit SecA
MRIFGSERIGGLMQRLGMQEGEEIEHPFITKAIETAQKRVEARNFDIRKQLLEYDNVMNRQREVIYAERRKVLEGEDLREHYLGMVEDAADAMARSYQPGEEGAFKAFEESVRQVFPIELNGLEDVTGETLAEGLAARARAAYEEKEKRIGAPFMRHLERMILLDIVDSKWKDHLRGMDNLREGIGLRAYGHKDPLVEYKREAFEAFQDMVATIKEDALAFIFRVQPAAEPTAAPAPRPEPPARKAPAMQFLHPEAGSALRAPAPRRPIEEAIEDGEGAPAPAAPRPAASSEKVGRNDPCPCGSGKKYKKCHGS